VYIFLSAVSDRAKKLEHARNFVYNDCKEAGQTGCISRASRYHSIGQKGATLWLTGLSGSGKSTIGKALEQKLVTRLRKASYRLDGDNVRLGLNRDLGFSEEDRNENVRRVGEVAALMADSGTITIASLISPYRADRDAVREQHKQWGVPFFEVYVDVSLAGAEERDPKGLYKKVRAGVIKSFTGVSDDAPYEHPLQPEIHLHTETMSVDDEVEAIVKILLENGILTGDNVEDGLAPPDGDKHVEGDMEFKEEYVAEAAGLPEVPLRTVDLQWLQVIAEGWAAPLTGFMREGALLQTLHFNSMLVDANNYTGTEIGLNTPTDFLNFNPTVQKTDRVSSSVPIVLPIDAKTKAAVEAAGKCVLVSPTGEKIAMMTGVEVFAHRKEEMIARMFGTTDYEHPYIKENILPAGDFLLGGEIKMLVPKVLYNDGLDEFRLSPKEIRAEFKKRGADAVVAFQTRNPTHAAHNWLMNDARRQLLDKGFKNPQVFLTPLGGWTKSDDVPLDVRIKQHAQIMEAGAEGGGLDPATTIMAIWPSPMVYAGPTEVQWHAKSRRNAGCSYFITGRDPAGLKGSDNWQASPLQKIIGEEDQYDGNHGRFVMQMSPALNGMDVLSFGPIKYDISDDTMKREDKSRKSDFISISGSKMRKMAAAGTPVCTDKVTKDWKAECVPAGFMPPKAWEVVTDYYKNIEDPSRKWIQYSTPQTA
jgi:3'-phosphoadenosine 5'-phosphosulfate synthase